VGLGTHRHRVVFYPISAPDPHTGLADINWIAEITIDNSGGWTGGDWNKRVRHEDFMHHFDKWNYDWIDIPGMLRGTPDVFEYPMIDRDPIPSWVDGAVALLGDAAHVMYPTGSNGASQAIMDARILGAALLEHGVNRQALQAYDAKLRPEISPLILRNRGAGPFGLLNLLDDRCGGVFDDIDAVIPKPERDEFMHRYKMAAGFAAVTLNAAPCIVPAGEKVSREDSTRIFQRSVGEE
jgi:2-polyprenyl-6-methoxyphenol hydroxylase-like FAD-dependent oxidoreductase